MATRLILICHAATPATRAARFPDDEPLECYAAAAAMAGSRALRRIDDSFRGPELRCGQTSEALGLDAVVDAGLADLDLGGWRGRTLTEVEADQPADLYAWLSDPDATPHGGESLSGLRERTARWLTGLPAGPARVAAVVHPAVIRVVVLHAIGAPLSSFWRIDVPPLSQTRLSRRGGRWQLGETGHPLVQT